MSNKVRRKLHYSAWIMRAAAVLSCMTIISAYLLSGVYAKYFTSTYGEDDAKVAKFDADISIISAISDTELTNDEAAKPKSVSIDITFSSNSEVVVSFAIKILTTDNDEKPIPLPAGTALIAEYGDNKSTVIADGDATEYIVHITTSEADVEIINGTAKVTIDCSDSTTNFTGNISLSAIASQVD